MATNEVQVASQRDRAKSCPKQIIITKEHKPISHFGYILEETVGSGAYAKVKKGRSAQHESKLAVKIIDREKAGEDVIEKFTKREIDIMRDLDHENVIRTHEVVMNDKFIFIIMDLAEEGDLLDFIIARQFLTEEMAQYFFRDFARGLKYIHDKGYAHRDLKCENLLIDNNFNLKISDFGFAAKITPRRSETYCGSLAYAAPEVINGKPYQAKFSDIWSMGVVLYAMLMGKLPFTESELTANKHSSLPQTLPISFNKIISNECMELIYSIMNCCPSNRLTIDKILEHKWICKPLPHDLLLNESISVKLESKNSSSESEDSSKSTQVKENNKIANKLNTQKRKSNKDNHAVIPNTNNNSNKETHKSKTNIDQCSGSNKTEQTCKNSIKASLSSIKRKFSFSKDKPSTPKTKERNSSGGNKKISKIKEKVLGI